jgi:hypothetical protein
VGSNNEASNEEDEVYYVYQDPIFIRALSLVGWALGWVCYWLARFGFVDKAEGLIDDAIHIRRANPGAVRAIGYLNGLRGLPAIRRGSLLVHGRIHDKGHFAGNGFYATYHVAAPNKARALALIKRFEWDAIPESIEIEEGELDYPDTGAEGILWVKPGRAFYSENA